MKNPNDSINAKTPDFVVPQVKGKAVKHEFTTGRGPAKQPVFCGKCRGEKDYVRNEAYSSLPRTDRPIVFPPTMVHVANNSDVCPAKQRASAPSRIRPVTGVEISGLLYNKPE